MAVSSRTERELADLEPGLRDQVRALVEACPYAIGITSAWRSREEQARLYDGWKRRLPGFNPANRPGLSKHEHCAPDGQPAAEACDLSYPGGRRAVRWAHVHAAELGLHFPIRRENWHVETTGRRRPAAPSLLTGPARTAAPPTEELDEVTPDDKEWLIATITEISTKIADDRLRILLRAQEADGTSTGHPNLTDITDLLHDLQRGLERVSPPQ